MVQLENLKPRKSLKYGTCYICEDGVFKVSETLEDWTSILAIYPNKDKDFLRIEEVKQNLAQAEADLEKHPKWEVEDEQREEYLKAVRDYSSELQFLSQDDYRWKKYVCILDNDAALEKIMKVFDNVAEDSVRAKSKAAWRPYENKSTGEICMVEDRNFKWYWRNGD